MAPEIIYEAWKLLEITPAELAAKKAIENRDTEGAVEATLNYMIYVKERLLERNGSYRTTSGKQ